eukprot:1446488-Prorocentrum_lima.AAC.1
MDLTLTKKVDMLDLEMVNNLTMPYSPCRHHQGELVRSVSSVGHAGVDGRSRASTPPLRPPLSPRERTST